jgi:acetoin utilization deacetylase AcuC-like enzyme
MRFIKHDILIDKNISGESENMLDLTRRISKGFLEIKAEIPVQKAFELLSDPKITTLIYLEPDNNAFYYLTNYIINNSYREKTDTSELKAKDIALKSIIFDHDEYSKDGNEYLMKFKEKFSEFTGSSINLILVVSENKPIGLLTDLDFTSTPEDKPHEEKTVLDKFIDSELDPINNLDTLYQLIGDHGFILNDELKVDIKIRLENRIDELNQLTIFKPITLDPESNKNDPNHKHDTQIDGTGPGQIKLSAKEDQSGLLEESDKKVEPILNKISVIYNPNHLKHRSTTSSPETPERITKIISLLKDREKIFNSHCKLKSDYPPAVEEDILRVHTKKYIDFIKGYAQKGGGFLGDSTYITKQTHELALLAVGGAIRAAEEVIQGKTDFSLGLIRPPGHHAGRDKYGGYCIYNNAAALARYLQAKRGMKKILILDWDAHAANGTMDIFYDDPTVMLISLHQDPHNYYPKTGFISQMGKLQGLGYTVNIEMPRGSSDKEYLVAFEELVLPLYNTFNPDFVIGCNGYDAHHSDPYTELQLTADGYYEFSKIFEAHMKNKMVILMEGGYHPFMGELTHTLINGLLGKPKPFEDKFHSLSQKVVSGEKTYKILTQNIKELKFNLNRYRIL